jgi:hypothetical protein
MIAVSLIEYCLSGISSNEPGFIIKHFCNKEVLDKTAKDSWITYINNTP